MTSSSYSYRHPQNARPARHAHTFCRRSDWILYTHTHISQLRLAFTSDSLLLGFVLYRESVFRIIARVIHPLRLSVQSDCWIMYSPIHLHAIPPNRFCMFCGCKVTRESVSEWRMMWYILGGGWYIDKLENNLSRRVRSLPLQARLVSTSSGEWSEKTTGTACFEYFIM